MSYFRPNITFLTALGAGVFMGLSGVVLYMRLTKKVLVELNRLAGSIAELQTEISELKQAVQSTKRRARSPGFYSVHASSGEEDEDTYEEAYGGSDTELARPFVNKVEEAPGEVTATALFERIDRLQSGTDEDKTEAYNLLQNNKSKFLTDAEFYWRLSKATYHMSQIEGGKGNSEKKKELVYAAKDLAGSAVKLDVNNANAHKWYAITIGSIGDYETTSEKIKNGYTYKEHIEKAIEINPQDPSNHYLLGRWCFGEFVPNFLCTNVDYYEDIYEVYMLSWLERKAAAALYAAPPTSTADEALKHFLEADRLNPGKWKENMLYIGKSYIEIGKYPEATEWLVKAENLPVVSQDDRSSQTEIQTLLSKYQR